MTERAPAEKYIGQIDASSAAAISAYIVELEDRLGTTGDVAYFAWTIIANAYEGDWSRALPEWREAAERWRDEFHATLGAPEAMEVPLDERKAMADASESGPEGAHFAASTVPSGGSTPPPSARPPMPEPNPVTERRRWRWKVPAEEESI